MFMGGIGPSSAASNGAAAMSSGASIAAERGGAQLVATMQGERISANTAAANASIAKLYNFSDRV
jgi:hypothetical protein